MASRAPRFRRTVTRTPAPIDPLAGAAENELAQELEAFSSRRLDQTAQLAEESAFQEGLASDGEADRSEATIRGRAFNRGVLASQQAAQQTDIRDSVAKFELDNAEDPERFNAQVSGMLEGLLEEADPRLHQFIRQRTADYAGRAEVRIIGRQRDTLTKEAVADLERGAEGLFEDATTAAFEGDVPMTEARRQEFVGLLEEAVDGGLIDDGTAAEMVDDFERKVTAQEVVGNFDRVLREEGLDRGVEMIRSWQDTDPSDVGLTADDHAAVTRQLVTLKNREQSLLNDTAARSTAAQRAEMNARRGRVQDSIAVARAGFSIDQATAEQVSEDIAVLTATGDEADIQRAQELARDFDVATIIQGQVHTFKRMPALARAEELNRLESALNREGASIEEVELLKALREVDAKATRALDTDPRGYLQRENLVEDPALDFSSAEGLATSIAARDTETGSQLAGEPIGRLTAAEADQFARLFNTAEVEEKAALLGVITAGAGEDVEATLNQIDQKGHKQLALLGGYVMQGQASLARDIMRGQQILAADTGVKPKRTDFQAAIDDTWGSAMGDWPEQRATFLEAAFAKYAELKGRNGDLSDIYDENLMEQALEAVLPTARFNGRRVALPPGITEDGFDDWTDTWDETTFEGVSGASPEDMLDLVRDDGRLVELGNGRYGVTVVSASTGLDRILIQEDGRPFMLEFPRGE